MDRKPIIAITAEDITDAYGDVYYMAKEIGDAVRRAGGVPVGAAVFGCVADYAEMADALILTGAQHVHPFRYGQTVGSFEAVMEISTSKDDFDFAILDAFLKAGKPVLGINRGCHVINAALGGTLLRAIPPKIYVDGAFVDANAADYSEVDGSYSLYTHGYGYQNIAIEHDSLLAKYLGETAVVNTFHHQACDKLGEGLRVTARAEDGVIEAFAHESRPIVGVQWDPEHTTEGYERDDAVYRMFIDMVTGRAE